MNKNIFSFLTSLFSKKEANVSIKSLIRHEAILDYYLPDIVKSLIYSGLITSIILLLYKAINFSKLEFSLLVSTFFLSFAAFAYSKASTKNNLSLLLPTVLVICYQKILVDLVAYNEIYLYLVTPISFVFFFSKCKSFQLRIKEVCEDYLGIQEMSDIDFNYLLCNLQLRDKETKDLINIAHFNKRFDWLTDILEKAKLKSDKDVLFYKVLPFLWYSPKDGYEIIKQFNLMDSSSNTDILKHLLTIDVCLNHDGMDVANLVANDLLTNNKDMDSIRYVVAVSENEGVNFHDVQPIIEKMWLEMNLNNKEMSKPKGIKI